MITLYVLAVAGLLVIFKGGAMGCYPSILPFISVIVERWQGSIYQGMDVIERIVLRLSSI